MATTPTATDLGEKLSGNVLLYKQPVPLNSETQHTLGLSVIEKPFMFVKEAHAVPIAVTEFGPAAMRYPIIFAGEEHQPVAIMSIRQNENLFLKDDGYFEQDIYVPAYIRRYPFVLAQDQKDGQLLVCIDQGAESVQENGEIPLFENGEPSQFTRNAIEFCTNFEQERTRTVAFIAELEKLGLFELKEAMFTPQNQDGTPGTPIKVAEYFGISEVKLNALPAEDLVRLRDNGALQQIYVHLQSLQNWERLVTRTMMKDNAAAPGTAAIN